MAGLTLIDTPAQAADYTRLRDRIETACALSRLALISIEVLDDEACDTVPLAAKADAADRIWSSFMAEISQLDV